MNKTPYPLIPLRNPETYDYTITYDLDGDNIGEEWTLHTKEIEYFPEPVANHIKRHFAEHIMWKRGVKVNTEIDTQNIMKEIENAS